MKNGWWSSYGGTGTVQQGWWIRGGEEVIVEQGWWARGSKEGMMKQGWSSTKGEAVAGLECRSIGGQGWVV